ncbi:MAG: hypothetical protein AB7H71_02385 [Alphaproteobacteria bacterium]
MEGVLKRAAAAPLPWSPRDAAGSLINGLWRRMAMRLYRLAERLPGSQGEPSPEWFRYPLP